MNGRSGAHDPSTTAGGLATGRPAHRRVVMSLALTHVGVDAVAGSVGVLLPALRDRFELSGSELGALVATFATTALLAQPLGGHLADRFGAHRVTAAGAVIASALLALVGAAPHLAIVYLLLIVGGFGAAAFHPAAAAVARDVAGVRAQAALGLFAAGGMVGLAVGPIVALHLVDAMGLAAVGYLMIPGVLLGVALAYVVPAPRAHSSGRLALEARDTSVLPIVAAATLVSFGVTAFTAGIPLWYAEATASATTSSIGWTLAMFQLAGALGGVVAAAVAARTSVAVTVGGALLLAPVPLVLSLAAPPGQLTHFALAAIGGALANAATPLLIAAAQQRAPGRVAAASGMVMGVASGLAGIGFAGVGALADVVGLRAALSVAFAVLVPAALVGWSTLRVARRPAPAALLRGVVSCRSGRAAAA